MELIAVIVGSAISAGTPVLFATTGEVLAQRTGIVNLGLEGAMLLGAVLAAWLHFSTGSVVLAILGGALGGAVLGFVHGMLVVNAKVRMLASGLCLFFVGMGLSAFWGYPIVGKPLSGLTPMRIPVISDIPFAGRAFFSHDVLVYLALVLGLAVWFVLFRTRLGLQIRATGENTEVAHAEGVRVNLIRVTCVTIGAALAGVGGAHIVLSFAHTWLEGIAAGRGWVAIGLVILARWNPLFAIPVAYIFGGLIAIQLNAQAAGIEISPYLLSMLPYLLTIAALAGAHFWARGSGMPAELVRVEK